MKVVPGYNKVNKVFSRGNERFTSDICPFKRVISKTIRTSSTYIAGSTWWALSTGICRCIC